VNVCSVWQAVESPPAFLALAAAVEASVAAAGATGAAGDRVWTSVGTKDESVDTLEDASCG
jgi:hypothetical protein